jgi:hypothetical protein
MQALFSFGTHLVQHSRDLTSCCALGECTTPSRWGGKPQGQGPLNPTSIENLFDPTNFTAPGTFYYDRVCAIFLFLSVECTVFSDDFENGVEIGVLLVP